MITVNEFCSLLNIVTKKHGKDVLITTADEAGLMHIIKCNEHLGHIDLKTGSLVWDGA